MHALLLVLAPIPGIMGLLALALALALVSAALITVGADSWSAAAPRLGPRLVYDARSGRLRVAGTGRSAVTPSVYWDNVVQSLVADARSGPTVGSFAYAVVHSAIFDAWYASHAGSYWRYHSSGLCSTRRVAVAYAGFHAVKLLYPLHGKVARNALNHVLKGCWKLQSRTKAQKIGLRAARNAFETRNAQVLPRNMRKFNWPSSIERWTPERVPIDYQRGPLQTFLTEQWGSRYTFGIPHGAFIWVPRPEPFLLVPGRVDKKNRVITTSGGVCRANKHGGLNYTTKIDVVNARFIKQAVEVIRTSGNLTPAQKFMAELWEQGGGTSYPPGSWMTIGQWVSARDRHAAGKDVRMFYALANAMSDAAVSTWFTKRYYDYTRPVRAIRDLGAMGFLGLISFYDVSKHRTVVAPATKFMTYQSARSDPSPPFPEFTSGHSGFSAAAAEVLVYFTRSNRFGASVTLKARTSRFEPGVHPKHDVTLRLHSFRGAAIDAGNSRIFGGIHFKDANIHGLRLGRIVGRRAFYKARRQWRRHQSRRFRWKPTR